MPVSVTMPRLGESVTEGTVTRWLKAEGEHVNEDEPLLEVSTDKVDTEIPSPASGILLSIKVAEDETVEIGTEIAVIGEAGESAEASSAPADAAPAPEPEPLPEPTPAPAPAVVPPTVTAPASTNDFDSPVAAAPAPIPPTPLPPFSAPAAPAAFVPPTPVTAAPAPAPAMAPPSQASSLTAPSTGDEEESGTYLTPLVRKLAAEHGVDVSTLQGTGVGGRIRKSDVLAAAERAHTVQAPPQASAAPQGTVPTNRGRVQKMSRRRTIIAARMVESMQTMAQLTTVVEVDVTKIARLRAQAKADFLAREGAPLSFLPFFTLAAVEALKVHPIMNSSIDTEEETITFHDGENIGIAVDTPAGLTVPVIQHAGDLNLAGLARKIVDLADRTRANKISPDELVGATFTITNTGSRGALFDTPIINQPQVAILGTGTVTKRAVVLEDPEQGDTIAIRSMVYLALSYDHRIIDGADAARFLATVKARLEAGAFEGDLGLA